MRDILNLRRAAWCVALVLSAASSLRAQPAVTYRIDAAGTRIVVFVGRSGALGFLGHEHAILATDFEGTLCADPADLAQAALRFSVPTKSLVIDTEEARRAAGLGRGPGADDVRMLQGKLLDRTRLAADSFATLSFTTRAVQRAGTDTLRVEGDLVIRDVRRSVTFPARVATTEQGLQFDATLRVRQSDYGIRPERVAGVVRVRDDVEVRVRIVAHPTGASCRISDAARASRFQ